ncbi:MAG: hypothetical protein NTX52_11885 [Planctomycetota bacterium]|nr:hypothetical protein [Planctomycetota bacterium]
MGSTAIGNSTEANGPYSIAMGMFSKVAGYSSVAIGSSLTVGLASYDTVIGKYFTNDVQNSFAVGFGQKDFSVVSGLVTVHNNLYVAQDVSAHSYSYHSSFYDKDFYGRALDYLQDSSNTIRINSQGQKEYNHQADPIFLKKRFLVTDYDKYTEQDVWDADLKQNIPQRIYETHEEIRGDLGMSVAWLRQCVYELKQENEQLKAELADIRAKLGVE